MDAWYKFVKENWYLEADPKQVLPMTVKTLRYGNCICLTGNTSFFEKPLIIVKTYIHFAVVDTQSVRGISAIFKDLGYLKMKKLSKIFSPKYWHIAVSEVKYHSCLSILCLFTRKFLHGILTL